MPLQASLSPCTAVASSGGPSGLQALQSLPMKYVAALDVQACEMREDGLVSQVGENGRVSFISACKQVMRFVCLGDDLVPSACLELVRLRVNPLRQASLEDLETVEERMEQKQREKLRRQL